LGDRLIGTRLVLILAPSTRYRVRAARQRAEQARSSAPAWPGFVRQPRMVLYGAPDPNHRAVAIDLLAQRLRTVEALAGQREQLSAAGVRDAVFGLNPVPQGPAMFPQMPGRLRPGGGTPVRDQCQGGFFAISNNL
jgi:hypothetical protein